MLLESLSLTNFRCFGPDTRTIPMSPGLTTFVGVNGSGKTAIMQALLRLFGVTFEQRRVRRQDFHVPAAEVATPTERHFVIEAILAFPELDTEDDDHAAVPEFFHQMATDDGGQLKCRLRLEATWTDDGSLDGVIEPKLWAVRTFGTFEETDCVDLKPIDRARIQVIYVPAARDGASQVTAFLRGRLWRAVAWSQRVKDIVADAGQTLNDAFGSETAVDLITKAVEKRWQEVHTAGTDTKPIFRPVDLRFQEFIRKVEVAFRPDESGRDRSLEDLSDGQRSLFHLAMTAATLDVEGQIADGSAEGFQVGGVLLPALTLIAVEEPENNLAPFYLSRIVRQIEDLTRSQRAQAFVSSHSASILARVDPTQVLHFRLEPSDRTTRVNKIQLPEGEEEAAKFIREAVRTYPELYFARFVVLGEGASEEVVLPRLAEALDLPIDQSFVAVVPLGGRHVNHLWRLLTDLEIPYATLLDLDWGRYRGGWGRIKTICEQLLAVGHTPKEVFGEALALKGTPANLKAFDSYKAEDFSIIEGWTNWLRQFGVFFCTPLDLDYTMLLAFFDAYKSLEPGMRGPKGGDPRAFVLGEDGLPALYPADHDEPLRWYRYLFLGRGKPSTHMRVLGGLGTDILKAEIPEELQALLDFVAKGLSAVAAAEVK
jgi:hypothetical protein